MAIEAALIKPVVDALLSLLREGGERTLQRNADKAVREAIRELLQANPDENRAQARIAVAKAAGLLSEDVLLAEDMLRKHRDSKARTAGKAATGRKRRAASTEPASAAGTTTTRKTADKPPAKPRAGAPRKPRR